MCSILLFFFFFFNDTATTEIYTLSLHDALPIYPDFDKAAFALSNGQTGEVLQTPTGFDIIQMVDKDRKSTRLNSSHQIISYAVFCLKKKKTQKNYDQT